MDPHITNHRVELDPASTGTMRSAKVWIDEPDGRNQWGTYGTSTTRGSNRFRDHDPRNTQSPNYPRDKHMEAHIIDPVPHRHGADYDPRSHIYECPTNFS